MFCSKCGKEIAENSSFCKYCGMRLNGKTEERTAQPPTEKYLTAPPKNLPSAPDMQYENQTSYTNINADRMSASADDHNRAYTSIIGSNIGYYSEQFQRLQNGEKDKINWASFFLSIYHAAYRNVWRDWLMALRAPLITEAVLVLCMTVAFFISFELGMILGMVLGIAYFVVMIWTLIVGIKFAKRFNRIYKEHVDDKARRGDLKPDTSVGRALPVLLIIAVISYATGTFTAVYILGDSGYYDQYYYSDDYYYDDYDYW